MSIFHLLVPFDKCVYESTLPNAEIINRMNWFIQTPLRGGALNGVNIIGNLNGSNFFFEPIKGTNSKGFNQFAGIIDGTKISVWVRLKPSTKKGLIIIASIILFTGIFVPLIDAERAKEIGSFWGGVGVFYFIILLIIKLEAAKTKNFIRQMLLAREV